MGGPVFLSCRLFGLSCPAMEFAASWVEPGLAAELRPSRDHTLISIPWDLKFSISPVVWTWHANHRSSGLTHSLGTKTPQVVQHGKKRKQKATERSRTI